MLIKILVLVPVFINIPKFYNYYTPSPFVYNNKVYSTHREINELLLEPIISGPTEEDLLEELNAMASAVTIEKVGLPVLPEVPTTVICSPPVARIEKSDDAILKELAGLIAS